MASASEKSILQIFEIIKDGRVVSLGDNEESPTKVINFDYYESILSPNVTGALTIADVASALTYNSKYEKQEIRGTLSSALPLTGDVSVRFKIDTKYGTLDFTKKPFLLNNQIPLGQESNKEFPLLNIVSSHAKQIQLPVNRKYTGNISNSVRKIIKEYLKVPDNKIFTSPSRNSMNFYGGNESLYKLICEKIAPKTIPVKGNPGYFFYETQDGFNFRAIDDLISQEPVATYYKNNVIRANLDNDSNDFKIEKKVDVKRDDLITAIKSGLFASRNIFWNPLTFEYTEKIFKLDGLEESLGGIDYDIPDFGSYTRTHFHILDVGNFDSGISCDVNNSPIEWTAKSTMRYNSLFSQICEITVPCNINLRAGDVIECDFEIITQDNKSGNAIDPTQSGRYLIENLCHHFDPKRSYTSMTLVRDSYGKYRGV
tara:strand:+ start:187 stop:1470 length:1284 start_codon:yes stop_codon:yes gene_type:complete